MGESGGCGGCGGGCGGGDGGGGGGGCGAAAGCGAGCGVDATSHCGSCGIPTSTAETSKSSQQQDFCNF